MNLKDNFKAHLAILGANIIYGLNYVIAKGIMPDFMKPRAIIFLRAIVTLVIFWSLSRFIPREKVSRADLFKLAVCSLFGVAVNQVLFFEGLNLTTPINAAIIITAIPVLVMIFSSLIIREKVTPLKITGILFGATGALLVILSAGKISLSSDTFTGNLLVFINASSYAVYIVLIKPLTLKYHPFTIMKWIFFFGFLLILPFCLPIFIQSDLSHIPPSIWMSIAYVVIASTSIAYLLNNFSLRTVTPTVNGIYIYLQPMLAAALAVMIGQDRITPVKVFASVLIILGVFLVSKRKKIRTIRDLQT